VARSSPPSSPAFSHKPNYTYSPAHMSQRDPHCCLGCTWSVHEVEILAGGGVIPTPALTCFCYAHVHSAHASILGVRWLSGTIVQPAIAPRQAPTLDVNLGPSVQTHRTTGFTFEKGSDMFTLATTDYHKRASHITTSLIPPPQHPALITSRWTMKGPAMSPQRSPASESGCRTMPRALVPATRSGARKNG